MISRVRTYASFVRVSHSVFALPFALVGAILAARARAADARARRVDRRRMVTARSAAMGFNRLVDARFDARNPRTAMRELPQGRMSRAEATVFVIVSSVLFVLSASRLGPLCFALSPVALADRVLVFAGQARDVLHAALSRTRDGRRAGGRLARGRRTRRLGAVAARPGDWHVGRRVRRALRLPGPRGRSCARVCDRSPCASASARVARDLARDARRDDRAASRRSDASPSLGPVYFAGVAGVAALLVWEQSLVRADDLSQVKRAFDMNGWVGILYLAHDGRRDLLEMSR